MAARRFLAPAARQGDGKGYLSQPARPYPPVADEPDVVARIADCSNTCDEPEAPSDAWLSATADRAFMLNQQARLADIVHAKATRPALTIEQRMADAKRRAKMQHVDLRAEFTAVRRMLDYARTESDKRRARTETVAAGRLESIELRLDHIPPDLAA